MKTNLIDTTLSESHVHVLAAMANRLRRESCAELVSVLFFQFLRFDVRDPDHPHNDRFVLSKGHAVPILWTVLAEVGAISREDLTNLRKIDSDLEGHPTPRNKWVDVATGSLGQGLSVGLGMALASRMDEAPSRIWVLLGDGETTEGSVWEAAALASHYRADNLTAIIDVNRLGQSEETMYGHNLACYESQCSAFGWNTHVIDGHSVEEITQACSAAIEEKRRPNDVIARTLKGKGVSFLENTNGRHGKVGAHSPSSSNQQQRRASARFRYGSKFNAL